MKISTIIAGLAGLFFGFGSALGEEVRGVELVSVPTFLVPPDSLAQLQPEPSISPRWTFEEQTSEEVAEFFGGLELPEDLRTNLMDENRWNEIEFGVQVFPTHDVVRQLPEAARAAIYRRLAESDLNPFQQKPFLFGADVKRWFRDSPLDPELIEAIDQLSYPIGRSRAFSDLSSVLARASEINQERALMRAIYGSPSWIVSVRWPGPLDWEGWLKFWTANGRSVDHVPFLEAMNRNPTINSVDLIHLLPPNARKRLNTWPSLSAGLDGVFPNSFSSALRFFQVSVPDTAMDADRAALLLERGYEKVEAPYRFGDVLIYQIEGDRAPVHADVYVADDLVFTKLSRNVMRPWILMKMEDVRPFFEPAGVRQLLIQGWRKRPPQE